jgi:hypothetical protein
MQIIGKLTTKLDRETGTSKSGKSWEKQSIVIEQTGATFNKEVVVSLEIRLKVLEILRLVQRSMFQ